MTRREDGLWQEKLPIKKNGRTTYKYFYGRTKTAVNKKIAAFKDAEEKGATFGTVADEWWEQHEKTLGPQTFKSYVPAINRAKTFFGQTSIRQIKPSDINVFLRKIVKAKAMSQKTARTQLMMINLIFKYAVQNGYTEINPAREIVIPKGLTKTPRKMPLEEDIKLVKANTGSQMGMFALWIMYTGCRRGELLALTWEDVDLQDRMITISKSRYQINNKTHLKEPKTEAGVRRVPLLTKLLEKLTPGHGLIFPGPDGELMKERRFELDWNNYRQDTGVTCTPHQLRHAYATMLFEAGISPKDMQELLGHAQLATTMDIYTEVRKSREDTIKEKLLDVDLV